MGSDSYGPELFDRLRSFSLPSGDYAVFGSGPLLVRRIIDAVSDLDVICRGEAWRAARDLIDADEHRLVVLDEITYPMNWGWIDTDDVAETIRSRPRDVSIVATGRDAPAELREIADTVTEMVAEKHAFDAGITAMRGIEF